MPKELVFFLFLYGTPYQFYSITLTFPLHVHIFSFINTSLFFRDFLADFIGGPLSVLLKNHHFFPSCAHIALHKHKLLSGRFSSLLPRGPPISFSQESSLFTFMGTYSPS